MIDLANGAGISDFTGLEDVQLYCNEYNNIPVGEVTGENNMHSRPARTAGLHGTLVRFVEPDLVRVDSISLLYSVFNGHFLCILGLCTVRYSFHSSIHG